MVFSWLNAQSNRLKVYVSNRVNQILELTNASQWNYVRTDKNLADMISRGTTVADISTSKIWWTGPDWLGMSQEFWEQGPRKILNEEEIPEQHTIKLALVGELRVGPTLFFVETITARHSLVAKICSVFENKEGTK